jgi:hypothetical protein
MRRTYIVRGRAQFLSEVVSKLKFYRSRVVAFENQLAEGTNKTDRDYLRSRHDQALGRVAAIEGLTPTDSDECLVDLDEAQAEDLRKIGLDVNALGDELQKRPDLDS